MSDVDPRMLHPQVETVHPAIAVAFYNLAVLSHMLGTYENGLVAGDPEIIAQKMSELRSRKFIAHYTLKSAHVVHGQTWRTDIVPLTTSIPEWADQDSNAAYATWDGKWVIYLDATDALEGGKLQYVAAQYVDGSDQDIFVADNMTVARARISATYMPKVGPEPPSR